MALEGAQKADELLAQLSDEAREKARGLKTPEEMLAFAKSEGIDLTDEQLGYITGGRWGGGGYR